MGHAFQSPLRRWDVLVGLCESINAQTFVEVGCKEGRTTGALLKALPNLRVIAIDPWAPVPNADEDYSDWDFKAIEREFWENVCSCTWNKLTHAPDCASHRCEMHQETSAQAVFYYEEPNRGAPFDVVFIDAAHDYTNALADIKAWWPLVREGGYLCGHDYNHRWPGVMRAVADTFPLMRVAVCPDSVWVVRKEQGLLRAAA